MTEARYWAAVAGAKWAAAIAATYWMGLGKSIQLLLSLMILDVITGIIVGATKRQVNSHAVWIGIGKKAGVLIILAAVKLMSDMASNYFQFTGFDVGSMVGWFYVLGEFISVVENCGRLGAPVPPILLDTIKRAKLFQQKQEEAAIEAQEKQAAAVETAKVAVDSAKKAQKATDKLIEALPDTPKPEGK